MGKLGTGLKAEVVKILTESKTAMRSRTVAEQVHTTSRIACSILIDIKQTKIPGFASREIDGVMWYAIGRGKLPKEKKMKKENFNLVMPVDGFRGWFNPRTGITGSKLGV
jgi:hypothetical protein